MRRVLATKQAVGALTACALMGIAFNARAQDIEPRAYSNAPVGVNFLAVSYAQSQGGLPDDPSLPVTNDNLKTSNAILSYARALGLGGKSGMFQAVVPATTSSGIGGQALRLRFQWTSTTPSSFTPPVVCQHARETISTSSGLPGSTAGAAGFDSLTAETGNEHLTKQIQPLQRL
jgi:hypothetical protein